MTRAAQRQPKAEQVTLLLSGDARVEAAHAPAPIVELVPAGDGQLHAVDPASCFLTAHEVIDRYGWGRTKGYRMLRSPGFPNPIGGDRYRLDTLIAWEDAQLACAPSSKPAPTLPARKRVRANCGQ